ncbi:MAG: HEPN domain-containing protein [Deltaproteobacteria bacterium]|jgi:HEPN domain-containing protein|nr:HEPN domain-containing protein [Deltaproteobacteria bacterium]
MTNDKQAFQVWLMASLSDFETANICFRGEAYFDAAIKCQQCLEKVSKAIYGLHYDFMDIPRTHNVPRILTLIMKKSDVEVPDGYWDFLDQLSHYYLDNRYPTEMGDTFFLLDNEETEWILEKTKDVFEWMLTLKP